DVARVQSAPGPLSRVVAQALAQLADALAERLAHDLRCIAARPARRREGGIVPGVQRPYLQVFDERLLVGRDGQPGRPGGGHVRGAPPRLEGVDEIARQERPPDGGGWRVDVHVVVPALQEVQRLLLCAGERGVLQTAEQNRYDQSSKVVM